MLSVRETRKSDADSQEAVTDPVAAVEEKWLPKFDELKDKMSSFADEAEQAAKSDADDAAEKARAATKAIEDLDDTQKSYTAEYEKERLNAQIERMESSQKSLAEFLSAERAPHEGFVLGGRSEDTPDTYSASDTEHSFFQDAAKSFKNETGEEYKRWAEAMGVEDVSKAMTQATGSTGGFLVPPQVSAELLRYREQANILRPLFSRIQVNADVLRIAAQTSGLLAGWVAELAEKPESELTFGEISVNVFWKAGMSVVSNQLLRNSNPSIDQLIYSDLGRRLAALEEIAFISGSGEGQPLGILKTPGVQHNGASPLTSTDVDDLLDEIVDGITGVYTEYYGAPTGILMHPRDWARIVKARKADATAEYFVGAPKGRDATDPLPGYGSGDTPTGRLFGLPVYTTRNVPTNAGAADNETRIIVGAWNEGLILDHAGVSLDSSEHVYFRTNQTIFRAEDAVGFTAARYPKAFHVIGGSGLAL